MIYSSVSTEERRLTKERMQLLVSITSLRPFHLQHEPRPQPRCVVPPAIPSTCVGVWDRGKGEGKAEKGKGKAEKGKGEWRGERGKEKGEREEVRGESEEEKGEWGKGK